MDRPTLDISSAMHRSWRGCMVKYSFTLVTNKALLIVLLVHIISCEESFKGNGIPYSCMI